MILGFIQDTIANYVGLPKAKNIGKDYTFVNNPKISEADLCEILETIEEELHIELVDNAWRFNTVNDLLNFIVQGQLGK